LLCARQSSACSCGHGTRFHRERGRLTRDQPSQTCFFLGGQPACSGADAVLASSLLGAVSTCVERAVRRELPLTILRTGANLDGLFASDNAIWSKARGISVTSIVTSTASTRNAYSVARGRSQFLYDAPLRGTRLRPGIVTAQCLPWCALCAASVLGSDRLSLPLASRVAEPLSRAGAH
jgi:hypothetical protein